MRTFRDAKAMARALRDELARKQITLTHAACLEIVATQLGAGSWNELAAAIDADQGANACAVGEAGVEVVDGHPGGAGAPPPAGPADFKDAIPILRIFDETKAKEFYVDFLGFRIDWEHRFSADLPLYMQVSRSGLRLHLSEHHGDASPGATVFVWMRGIRPYHAELTGKVYRYNRPGLEAAPWDAWVMEVNDPFGNRLRFSEPNAAGDPRA